MIPLLATKLFTAFNSVSKLTENPLLGEGALTAAGAPFSSLEQALAKQATQARDIGPVIVDKNSPRFIKALGLR
jgi:hypothetical protein